MAGLKGVGKCRTICEVLREIEDLAQSDSKTDRKIRIRVVEAADMAKRMARKLFEYSKGWDRDWWAANPEYEAKIKQELRGRPGYKVGAKG